MADIQLQFNNVTGFCDWSVASGGGDLNSAETLETAVLLSLFTDKRAPADLQIFSTDRRGFWGTTYNPAGQAELGSLLWTLGRSVKNDSTSVLRTAEMYALQALNWLITQGVAATVTATAFWLSQGSGNLGLSIVITQPNGVVNQFSWVWSTLS
jgi:phage gp46-like protein